MLRTNKKKRRRAKFVERLEPKQMLDASLIISEFMASNDTTLADEDGEYSDWIRRLWLHE